MGDVKQGWVACALCGRAQPVGATNLTEDDAHQMAEKFAKQCLYIATGHHSGQHDVRECRKRGCGAIERDREQPLLERKS